MFNKKDPVFITKVCLLIVCGAFVFSIAGAAFSPRAQAMGAAQDSGPSFRNPDAIIHNSKDLPHISLGTFLKKIAKTTGIYAFINEKIEKETTVEDVTTGKHKTTTVPGWQELLMIAVGFLIVYLGAAKNFEPLLLIPIGFGTIFVNIPFAGMGDPGVWNETLKIFEHRDSSILYTTPVSETNSSP